MTPPPRKYAEAPGTANRAAEIKPPADDSATAIVSARLLRCLPRVAASEINLSMSGQSGVRVNCDENTIRYRTAFAFVKDELSKCSIPPRKSTARPSSRPTAIPPSPLQQLKRPSDFDLAFISIELTRSYFLYNILVMELISYIQGQPNLDALFAALADSTRRAILLRLVDGQASVNEIAAPFEISQPAVSKHLKVLERAGLIERDVDEQRRPARLKAEQMAAAVDWLTNFSEFWGASFDQLDDLLVGMKQTKKSRRKK